MSESNNEVKQTLRRDNEEYKIVKKLPKRFPAQPHDVYVSQKTDFRAQYEKCKYILANGATSGAESQREVNLYAMGSAINRAINLALRLKKESHCQELSCFTSTIALEDDLIPLVDHLELSVQHRYISAVYLKLKNNPKA